MARPGDKQPRGFDPKKLLADETTTFGDYNPPIGQQNIFGFLGDKQAFRIPGRPWAPYIETRVQPSHIIQQNFYRTLKPIGAEEVQRYVPPEQTLMEKYPLYRRPPIGNATPGSLAQYFGDTPALHRGMPQWAMQQWERNLKRYPIDPNILSQGIEPLDQAVFRSQVPELSQLANQLKPFHLTAAEANAAIQRVPIEPIIQDLARSGRTLSPAGIIPGAVGAVAAPLIINQLPLSNDQRNVLTSAAEGASLGSMGFGFGDPRIGLATTALGTILGGGKALLGL